MDAQGLVVGWNPAAETLFGHTAAAMRGKPVSAVMPEEYRAAHRDGLARALAGGPSGAQGAEELAALRADGSRFPVEVTRRRWESPQGVFFTAIIRDISARKAAERSRRESDQLFRTVAETSGSLLALLDREGKVRG